MALPVLLGVSYSHLLPRDKYRIDRTHLWLESSQGQQEP